MDGPVQGSAVDAPVKGVQSLMFQLGKGPESCFGGMSSMDN